MYLKARIATLFIFLFFPIFHIYAQTSSRIEPTLKEQARQYRHEGYRLQSMGDSRRALSLYQKAVEIDPLYAKAYNDIGVIFEEEGRLGQAEEFYKKALEIDPDFMAAHTNLAFLYERMGDIKKATYHWKKRYVYGQKGQYWYEVARQRLLKLGTYPEIRRKKAEKEAALLSRKLSYKREKQRLALIEEAEFYFKLGERAFQERSYSEALKNLDIVLSLDHPRQELKEKSKQIIRQINDIRVRQRAFTSTKDALEYIENDDYLSAADRLKEALSAVFRIAQEDFSQTR